MKALGVLVIGLGLVLIVIGVMGTQTQILNDMKSLNPKLRQLTGTKNATSGTAANTQASNNTGGGQDTGTAV